MHTQFTKTTSNRYAGLQPGVNEKLDSGLGRDVIIILLQCYVKGNWRFLRGSSVSHISRWAEIVFCGDTGVNKFSAKKRLTVCDVLVRQTTGFQVHFNYLSDTNKQILKTVHGVY